MKILIADHSPIVRERLINLLADLKGVEVAGQAERPAEAKDLAERLKPDVAILDLQIFISREADVVFGIKNIDPVPKVIILANEPYPEIRNLCLDRGADYFFDKSAEFQKMVSLLRSMVPDSAQQCS